MAVPSLEIMVQNVHFLKVVCEVDEDDKKMLNSTNVAGCALTMKQSGRDLLQEISEKWNNVQHLAQHDSRRIQFKKDVLSAIGMVGEIVDTAAQSHGIDLHENIPQ